MADDEKLPAQIPVTDEMRVEIRGALAEIDPAQMAIISRMTPEQRSAHGFSISDDVLRIAVELRRTKNPELRYEEALRLMLADYYHREASISSSL